MHCQNFQGKVIIKFSDLNIVNVLFVADIRESIWGWREVYTLGIISLLSDSVLDVRKAGADAFANLSEQGKVSKLLSRASLMYS
jgi:hypothetical protein